MDIWRPVIVEAPVDEIVRRGSLDGLPLRRLPAAEGPTYSADPFGIWRDDHLFIFVEEFDYRTEHGTIAVHVLDEKLRWVDHRTVLSEPWHLSYPVVFDWQGATWLMPEACASGAVTLYRARAFPWDWEPVRRIELPGVPVDATPLHHGGRWWLFYSTLGQGQDQHRDALPLASHHLTHLSLAWAETPLGPWTPHPANPVMTDGAGLRPGGRAFVAEGGGLFLPVQDCSGGYGSALRLLHVTALDPQRFEARLGQRLTAPDGAAPFVAGCHTLTPAGPVTLIDVKEQRFSLSYLASRLQRKLSSRRSRPPAVSA